MNKHGGGQAGDRQACCSFHPREVVVGVCAHCLKDRLLLLLANAKDDAVFIKPALIRRRTSSISLPKVFALGSSFLQRIDSRHRHADGACSYSDDDDDDTTSVASLDDSFISIKFEDNGKATWDKAAAAAAPARVLVVAAADHVKRGGVTRWRKQVVGRLLQLARWKRSSTAKAMDAGNKLKTKAAVDKATRGRGWIRSITRRRAHGDRAWS